MREHDEAVSRLGEFYDGQLAQAEAEACRLHIESCPQCRASIKEFERISTVFFTVKEGTSGEDFVQKVMARIETDSDRLEEPVGSAWLRLPVFALAMAAAAFLLIANVDNEPFTLDDLLLAGNSGASHESWVLGAQPPDADDILTSALEGR